MKIDSETGLPALPEGFVWVVSEKVPESVFDYAEPGSMLVSIHKKVYSRSFRKGLKRVEKLERWSNRYRVSTVRKTDNEILNLIKSAAYEVYVDSEAELHKTELAANLEQYVGVYPPKKI